MRSKTRAVFLVAILLGAWGCAPKGAKLQKSVAPPDKTLYETGSEFLQKGQYLKARLAFQNLMMTYPDSEMAPEAHFAIGDSFYEEGGTENFLQAENQFKDFIVFYPAHPKAPDALLKIISINMREMGTPDRDQHNAYKALQDIKRFLREYPDSDYIPIVKQFRSDVEENLAKGDLGVGRFYEERGNLAGARGRYKEIIDSYPDYSDIADIYYRLGSILEKANNPDEAAIYYSKVVAEYPFSKRNEEAKTRLTALGKPLPQVNESLAAANQAKVRVPEGFSPLKVFIDFSKALGIVSEPDRYEEARKSVDAEKAKTAEAAAKQAQPGPQGAEDILIESEIRKSASGEASDSTVLRSTSGDAIRATSDKKKEPQKKRYSKNP
jgi:outer membrane assembly lipoprotein YfiO